MEITAKGIDVSAGSGKIDFDRLKSAGYTFVIPRAGFGSSVTQVDDRFYDNADGALKAGLDLGAYWFIYARSVEEAEENARCFRDIVSNYWGKLTMPVFIDFEYDSVRYYEQQTGKKMTRDLATKMIRSAMDVMIESGYYTGVYLNPDYIENRVNYRGDLDKYGPLWLAQWSVTKPSYDCGLWQANGDTKTDFASGGVDIDYAYVNYPPKIRMHGLNGLGEGDDTEQSNPLTSIESGGAWEIHDDGHGLMIKLRR